MDHWDTYLKHTKNLKPRPLLLETLHYVKNEGQVLDLGAGSLNDTRFLLEYGFHVTAVDSNPSVREYATDLPIDCFNLVISTFEDFSFPEQKYDLVNAQMALPFNKPETFIHVFNSLKNSLANGGIFAGQFFGTRDEWASRTDRTFHTREEVIEMLKDLTIIKLSEEKKDGTLVDGSPKHWHIFHVIAQKPLTS